MTSTQHQRRCAQRQRRGFTLVEVLTSLAITVLLLGAMGSAIMVVARSVPSPTSPTAGLRQAHDAENLIASELRYAISVPELTANAIMFTVADRDSNGSPETIRYYWTGTPGDPLRRVYNGAEADLIPSVQSFSLVKNVRSVTTTTQVTTTTTSPELLFSKFDGWPGITPLTGNSSIGLAAWAAEFFTIDQCTLPDNAKNVKVSRVRLFLRQEATSGSITVGIHRSIDGENQEPSSSPLGTPATVAATSLPATADWVDITMPSDVGTANLNKEFVIVLKGTAGTPATWTLYTSLSAPKDTTPVAMWSTNSGGTWNPAKSSRYKNDHLFYVYGTYQTDSTADVTTTRYYLTTVGLQLCVGADATAHADTMVAVLDQPEVAMP